MKTSHGMQSLLQSTYLTGKYALVVGRHHPQWGRREVLTKRQSERAWIDLYWGGKRA